MGKFRRTNDRLGWAWPVVIGIVKPVLLAVTRRDWIDGEKIPASGGCVVVMNHVSHIDPLCLGHLLYEHGRLVRYLTKDALWRVPVVGPIIADAGQIPVSRSGAQAGDSFQAAVDAVNAGELVGVYPEGSITKDPEGWPMRGKTGAARIALATDCPVIPIGQWGAQDILPAYSAKPHLIPPRTAHYKVGDPVDLSEYVGKPLTNEVLHQATEVIMDAVTALVAELRGEEPPAHRFDPRVAGVREYGNPGKPERQHGPEGTERTTRRPRA